MAGRRERGAVTLEFVIAYGGIMLPMTFGLLFMSQLLWVWHSINEFTRQGASYAATHCWQGSGGNVLTFMQNNLPPMIDQAQISNGPAQISINYFSKDPASGQLAPFECDSDCSTGCIPDTVTVSVTGFQFGTFFTSLGIAPVKQGRLDGCQISAGPGKVVLHQ